MTRETAAQGLGWLLVLGVEAWFAAHAFVKPTAGAWGLEVVGLAIAWAWQARLAPPGPLRSPLLPAAIAVGLTAVATTLVDPVRRSFLAIGLIVAGGYALRRVDPVVRRRPMLVVALVTPIAGLVSRYLVLALSVAGDRGAVAHPAAQLLAEVSPPARHGENDGPPILLLTVDTMRWDHLVKMAAFQRVAERGRAWPRAMSTASWTLPAMASVLTGLPAAEHGAGARPGGGYQGVAPGVRTLPEDLAAAGYVTSAVFNNSWMVDSLGFERGFERFAHVNRDRAHRLLLAGVPDELPWVAHAAVDRALEELAALPPRGSFLWVHFVDTHLPYAHAEGPVASALTDGKLRGGLLVDDATREAVRQAYQHECDLLDAELVRLLDGAKSAGWLDSGLVVLTADHGEELWDHGAVEHGHSHHGEVVDVALAIGGPSVKSTGEGGVPSLLDVTSTIRAAAGLPPNGVDLRDGVPADRVATAWGNAFYRQESSARQGTRRVIAHDDGTWAAYDLATDPDEREPLALPADDPLVQAARGVRGPEIRASEDVDREALQALGYVE